MDKITVLIPKKDVLSEHIECVPIGDKIFDSEKINKFTHDEPCMFPSPKKYVDITDEEIEKEIYLFQRGNFHSSIMDEEDIKQAIQKDPLSRWMRTAMLAQWKYIKSRINQ